MATTVTVIPSLRLPLLARWHLLSLDAPCVAALWTCFVARVAGVALPLSLPVAMFLAVWILYASDRLLDARPLDPRSLDARRPAPGLELRHRFHLAHRPKFSAALVVASAALIPLLWRIRSAPGNAFPCFLSLGIALAGWLAVVHLVPARQSALPKELAPAIFFPAAVFLPTFARAPELRLALLLAGFAFGLLCYANCLLIHRWENPLSPAAHGTTRLGITAINLILSTLIASPLLVALPASLPALRHAALPLLLACGLSAIALHLLDRFRDTLDRTTLRAAADLALLTPLLLLPFLR